MTKLEDIVTALVLSLPLTITAFVVLLILKLAGLVSWSWWIVTSPIWGVLGLIFLIAAVYVVLFLSAAGKERRKTHSRRR